MNVGGGITGGKTFTEAGMIAGGTLVKVGGGGNCSLAVFLIFVSTLEDNEFM